MNRPTLALIASSLAACASPPPDVATQLREELLLPHAPARTAEPATPIEASSPESEPVAVELVAPEPATSGVAVVTQGRFALDDDLELSIWRSERYRRQYAMSFMQQVDVEPGISAADREPLIELDELLANDDLEEAIALLEYHVSDTANAQFDLALGNLYFRQERFEEAVALSRRSVEKYDRFLRGWDRLGKAYARLGEWELARPALIRVLELGGNDPDTYGLLAYAHGQAGDYYSSEFAYRMAILLDPSTPDWKVELARTLVKQRKFVEAVPLLDALIESDPENPAFWLQQANAFKEQGLPRKAMENYELVDQMGKSTPDSLNRLGLVYMTEGLSDLAVDAFTRALQANPDAPLAPAIQASRLLAFNGELDAAGTLLNAIESLRALDITNEDRKQVLDVRASVALAQGGGEAEAEVLASMVELDPMDGRALIELGKYHTREADPVQARFFLERAQAIPSFEAEASVFLAQMLAEEGAYSEALSLVHRAQSLDYKEHVQTLLQQLEERAKQAR